MIDRHPQPLSGLDTLVKSVIAHLRIIGQFGNPTSSSRQRGSDRNKSPRGGRDWHITATRNHIHRYSPTFTPCLRSLTGTFMTGG